MTTYNSYEAAKIANPESVIYKASSGNYATNEVFNPELCTVIECNPADHCMTVEKFLDDGNKFQVGDYFISIDGMAVIVGGVYGEGKVVGLYDVNNALDTSGADKCYILRAAALEEKKPRTKVEHVKCEFSREWEAVKYYNEEGELFVIDCNGNYSNVNDISGAWYEVICRNYDSIYRRIETQITWKEELYNYLDNSCEMSDDFDGSFTIEIEGRPLEFNLNDDEFVDMCKLVASLNSVN